MPDSPGAARQEMYGTSVNNEVYLWGGFSYSESFCYRDGYKLSREQGKWLWTRLPDLVRRGAAGNLSAIGSRIHLVSISLANAPETPQACLWDEWHPYRAGVFRGRRVP